MLNSSVSFIINKFIIIGILYGLLLQEIKSISLNVNVDNSSINQITNYTWIVGNINSSNSLNCTNTNDSNCFIVLIFPSNVSFFNQSNSTTEVMQNNQTINSTTINPNNISFYATGQLNDTMVFKVINVKNPSETKSYNFSILIGNQSLTYTILYNTGQITNCSIQFDGVTNQKNITAQINFQTSSPINDNSVTFNITGLTFDSSNNISCSITLANQNGIVKVTNAVVNNQVISCKFSNLPFNKSQSVNLSISGVISPSYPNYTISGFSLVTMNSNQTTYDIANSCQPKPVQVDTRSASFQTNLAKINSIASAPQIITDTIYNGQFKQYDLILIYLNGINFLSVGSSLTIAGNSSGSQKAYNKTNNNGSQQNYTFINSDNVIAITLADKMLLTFMNSQLQLPSSATPQTMQLKFVSNVSNVYMEYLIINAKLIASPIPFSSADFNIICTSSTIGDIANYNFTLALSQPLGKTPFIYLYLPQELLLSQMSNETYCILQTNLSNILQCQIGDIIGDNSASSNKTIKININSSTIFQATQKLNIGIFNLINPSNPQKRNYTFGVEIYYDQNQIQSMVQNNSVAYMINYTQRVMNVVINDNISYMVNQTDAVLQLQYKPGVDLRAGLVITINFTYILNSSIFINMTYDNDTQIPVSSVTNFSDGVNLTSNLAIGNKIKANSTIYIHFGFVAPPKMIKYDAITDIVVAAPGGIKYEENTTILSIYVGKAIRQTFQITPVLPMAGASTTYTIYFFTNVPHPSKFYLKVNFPLDIPITNAACSGCSGTPQNTTNCTTCYQIWIPINLSTKYPTYTINISDVWNPRIIGATGMFSFQTFDDIINGSGIIIGDATTMISMPSVAYPYFSPLQSYYKSNTERVNFTLKFKTNKLQPGDYLKVFFDYRTYSIINSLGTIQCTRNSTAEIIPCVKDTNLSTTYTTVVIINITQNMTNWTAPYVITINGLISSPNTYYTQQFQVPVRSYDSIDRWMDQGFMTYNLSCQSGSLVEKSCKTCVLNASDSSGNCTSCYPGYYLYADNLSCVTNCAGASGYQTYANDQNSTNMTCTKCTSNCSRCISQTQCLTCQPNFLLYQNSTCMSGTKCPETFYQYNNSLGQQMCIRCWDLNCTNCTNGNSFACIQCANNLNVQGGRCSNSCAAGYYPSTLNGCLPCDNSCNGCNGNTSFNCTKCRSGFFMENGNCSDICHDNLSPRANGTCGCDGYCLTCPNKSTSCETCDSTSSYSYLYNKQCKSSCPNHTYENDVGKICIDCKQGCDNCSQNPNICLECLPGYNFFNDNCYTDCKTVGDRYSSYNKTCIKCSEGCDLCHVGQNDTRPCTLCKPKYTLVNYSCTLTCVVEDNCPIEINVKIPLPGSISATIWILVLIIFKLFVVKKLYMPYSFMFIGCLIEFTLVIVILISEYQVIRHQLMGISVSRLLQTVASSKHSQIFPKNYQYAIIGLLLSSLIFNYVANIIYIYLFCKYLKKFIPDRQIDKISNYLVIVVGLISNYRFSLVSYSKLFPKPNIMVENQSKLTPVHYMCIASIFAIILPLASSGILIYNYPAKSDLFMMGIDLLIIVLLQIIFTIWMVSVDKDDDYFQSTKKYKKEQFNQTKQGIQQNNQNNQSQYFSKAMLFPSTNIVQNCRGETEQIYQSTVFDKQYGRYKQNYKGNKYNKDFKNNKQDIENEPLPTKISKLNKNNLDVIKIKSKNQSQIIQKDTYQLFDDKDLNLSNNKQINANQQLNTSSIDNLVSDHDQKTQKNYNKNNYQIYQKKNLPQQQSTKYNKQLQEKNNKQRQQKNNKQLQEKNNKQRQQKNKKQLQQKNNKQRQQKNKKQLQQKNKKQLQQKNKKQLQQKNKKQLQQKNKKSQIQQFQSNIKSKIRQLPLNFSKEKKPFKNNRQPFQTQTDSYIEPKFDEGLKTNINKSKQHKQMVESQCFEEPCPDNISQSTFKQQSSQYLPKKQKKPLKINTQRSQIVQPSAMKKRAQYGVFQSQKDTSQADELDFDSLMKTKIIEKNKDKINQKPGDNNQHVQYEQCSPSWFNVQNQRFDVQDNSDTSK